MCTYLLPTATGYYFRRAIPANLQPVIGKREFKFSLRTKDREEAKRLIPAHTIATDAQLDAARKALGAGAVPTATQLAPTPQKSPAALERERARAEYEEAQAELASDALFAADMEMAELGPIMDAIEAGTVPDASPADLARAGQLLAIHQRQLYKPVDIKEVGPVELVQPKPQPEPTIEPSETAPEVSMLKLYERWASSGIGNPKTISRWRPKVEALIKHLGHDDVSKVKRADLNAWIETIVVSGLTKKTILAGYVPAIRVPFNVAFEDGLIPVNPASGLKVRAPKAVKLRERDLTDDEAATILKATVGSQSAGLAVDHARARRWVPWLLAYTGARVGEITQLRAKDIQQEDGIWFIHITPEAGSVKTSEARKVPLHSHLIEQGFAKFAKAGDTAPLFYRDGAGSATHPASKVRAGDLAKWVRSLGIKAPQPNHGWRHRFKSQAFAVSMDPEAADIMQGHAPRVEAGKYGQRGLPRLRDELEKLERYQVETA